ncbi:MAG TPA: tRNA pseudouridine(38-40) synthase TruA [Propionibacteriaceae bacterium]
MTTGHASDTRRWRLEIRYDGTAFSGWAVQPDRRTVQGEIEYWVAQVLRLSEPVALVCAGRTDAGVHARGQVAHVDLPADALPDPVLLHRKLARVLPGDVVVRAVTPAPPGFDARFSAVWRRYSYRLSDTTMPPDPLLRHLVGRARFPLDLDAMNEAAATLLGLHDFSAFCRRREGATTIRTLLELSGRRLTEGPLADTLEFTVRADAFCHSMVRSLVGALVAVGSGRHDLAWLARIRAEGLRHASVEVMPAQGLTLEEVRYPPNELLALRSSQARSRRDTPSSSAAPGHPDPSADQQAGNEPEAASRIEAAAVSGG